MKIKTTTVSIYKQDVAGARNQGKTANFSQVATVSEPEDGARDL